MNVRPIRHADCRVEPFDLPAFGDHFGEHGKHNLSQFWVKVISASIRVYLPSKIKKFFVNGDIIERLIFAYVIPSYFFLTSINPSIFFAFDSAHFWTRG